MRTKFKLYNMDITKYSFKGNEIAFMGNKKNVMINATQMAKPFGKLCKDWLRTEQSQRMIAVISERQKCLPSDLVKVTNGDNGGTWMHEDVALVFAQWLSPEFYLWCNDRIKELMTKGVATIANDDEAILHAIHVLEKRIEESKAKQRELEAQNNILTTEIKDNAPKVSFANAVADSDNCILIREFAKILQQNEIKMGEIAIFKWLRSNGYLLNKGDAYNLPSKKAMDLQLFRIKKTTILNPDGTTKVTTTPKMTGKGQIYFLEKLKNQ